MGLVIAGVIGYFFVDKKETDLITRVNNLMVLPDEVPKIAMVTDATKLESEKFFRYANNGDQVLIFNNALKAVLYRPSINKIIDVAVVLPVISEKVLPTPTVASEQTIALYNGTKKAGLTDVFEKLLKEKFPNIIIVTKEKAIRSDFDKTIIVDVAQKDETVVKEMAQILGATISPLPNDETKPEVDLIIILGTDSIKQ